MALAAAAIGVAATRLLALSRYPWDWDEILFCLSLGDYNMAAHHPHPPGFPLYVALAKLARLFTDTDFAALQVVNVLAAVAVFPVCFRLARAFRLDFATSFAAAGLFSFLPNVWFYGGTGFSDLPAIVLYLAAIAAYLEAGTSARRYFLASFLLAAALLIRPQNALIAVFPWTIATLTLYRARNWRALIGGTAIVVLLVAGGYGAAAYETSVNDFVGTITSHSKFVQRVDSAENPKRPALLDVLRMQLDPYDAGKASLALNLLALVALVRGRRRSVTEILLTFAPYFLFMTFALSSLGFSRLALSYSPAVAMLAAEGIGVLAAFAARWRPRLDPALRIGIVALLLVRLVTWMLPAFDEPRTTMPAPNAATLWIRDHVDPVRGMVFVHDSMWPWARYYLPNHRQVQIGDDREELRTKEGVGEAWILTAQKFESANAIPFSRPRNRTWNVVAKRYFDAYVLPATDLLARFGTGWNDLEGTEHGFWRWSTARAVMELPPLQGNGELRLRFEMPADTLKRPARVTFTLNGQPIATHTATQTANEVRYVVAARGDAPNVLQIDCADPIVPARLGLSDDGRELGLRLIAWGWRRVE